MLSGSLLILICDMNHNRFHPDIIICAKSKNMMQCIPRFASIILDICVGI